MMTLTRSGSGLQASRVPALSGVPEIEGNSLRVVDEYRASWGASDFNRERR